MAITKKDIEKLAELSRLDVSDNEAKVLQKNLDDILAFVSKLKEAPGDLQMISVESGDENANAAKANVFREDKEPHKEAEYSESLLKEAPQTERGFLKVKKVFGDDQD